MIPSHRVRSDQPPPARPAPPDGATDGTASPDAGPEQVPGFDERDADRGHRANIDVEGGPARPDTAPVDTEGT